MTTSINLINLKENYLHRESIGAVDVVFGKDNVNLVTPPYNSIQLTSNKSILSKYDKESNTLYAQLMNSGENVSLSGIPITFKKGSLILDTIYTNSNGLATLSNAYESEGIGDLTFYATDGNISGECSIEDVEYYNSGSKTSGLDIGSGVSCTSNGDYLNITTSTSGEKYVYLPYYLSSSDNFEWTFEIAELGNIQHFACFMKNATTASGFWCAGDGSQSNGGLTGTNWNQQIPVAKGSIIKVKQDNGVISYYIDDTLIYSKTTTLSDTWRVGFYTNSSRIQKIKNIKIKKPNSISLTATKNILSKSNNESTTLTATINDGNNKGIKGLIVQLYDDTIPIANMVDNNDGTYTYVYNSQGANNISFIARYYDYESNTINVEDCDAYYVTSQINNFTTQTDGSTTFRISDYVIPYDNYSLEFKATGSVQVAVGDKTSWVFACNNGLDSKQIYTHASDGTVNTVNNLFTDLNVDYKIEVEGTTIKVYKNNVLTDTYTNRKVTGYGKYLRIYPYNNSSNITYLKVKALHSLSLTSSKQILSYHDKDTTTLIGTYTMGEGHTVGIYNATNNKLVGTMTDNNDGTYSYTYRSIANGDIEFYAKSSKYSSNSLTISNRLFYDDATTNKSSNYSKVGATLSYDSTNKYYTCTNTGSTFQTIVMPLTLPSTYTVECDIMLITSSSNVQPRLMISTNNSSGYYYGVRLCKYSDTFDIMYYNGSDSVVQSSVTSQTLSYNVWYHVELSYDGASSLTAKLYSDNTLLKSITKTASPVGVGVGIGNVAGSTVCRFKNLSVKTI